MNRKIPTRTQKILGLLRKRYPKEQVFLRHRNVLELLVATILSSQCTDSRVNRVTEKLFQKYKKLDDYVGANPKEFEKDIRSTGFYRNKTKHILASARKIKNEFNGKIPETMGQLIALPGVGRKSANVILSQGFGKKEGIAVDTHVKRVSFRLGLTRNKTPEKIEQDLVQIIPQQDWGWASTSLISLGRENCFARKPDCAGCFLNRLCPSAFSFGKNAKE